jgi:uncharacterized protein (TIGR02757 family)
MSERRALPPARLRRYLNQILRRYHCAAQTAQDPVGFVRRYTDLADREIAALVAASLAFGSLRGILRSVERVLSRLGPHPAKAVVPRPERTAWLHERLEGFRHRWVDSVSLIALLEAAGDLQARDGSLERTFRHAWEGADRAWQALDSFVHQFYAFAGTTPLQRLWPDPCRGSACKRVWLFLRWMTRRDEVDPGGWDVIRPSDLRIPLDVHTFRAARRLGWTRRKRPDRVAAEEVTHALRCLCPRDPVLYDFALAHAGAAQARPRRRSDPHTHHPTR